MEFLSEHDRYENGNLPRELDVTFPRNMRRDDHHVMHNRKVHDVYSESAYIRNALIARDMPRGIHNNIHSDLPQVPLLGNHALRLVARSLQPRYDVVQDGIDDFSFAVEESNRHPKCKPLERQLGELVIATVRAQLPYIDEAMPRKPKLHIIQGGAA